MFLFAVQGGIQRFSDLKVISFIILNKFDVQPPPMTGCVSILPLSVLSAQLGGLFHSENRISSPQRKTKSTCFLGCYLFIHIKGELKDCL